MRTYMSKPNHQKASLKKIIKNHDKKKKVYPNGLTEEFIKKCKYAKDYEVKPERCIQGLDDLDHVIGDIGNSFKQVTKEASDLIKKNKPKIQNSNSTIKENKELIKVIKNLIISLRQYKQVNKEAIESFKSLEHKLKTENVRLFERISIFYGKALKDASNLPSIGCKDTIICNPFKKK